MNFFTKDKNYNTIDNYYKQTLGTKVYKILLNGGFTCPNRDGKISYGGCSFCSSTGSGEFVSESKLALKEQFNLQKEIMSKKWKNGKYIVYFSSFTNTYASVDYLRKLYFEAISLDDDIIAISIATRPDCLDDDILELLAEVNKIKKVIIELGVQTFSDEIALTFNRGYKTQIVYDVVNKLNSSNIDAVIHLINGLPGESKESMIENAKLVSLLGVSGIKIHMLHLIKNSRLGQEYLQKPFPILSLDEYVELVVTQIRHLSEDIIIHRISADGKIDDLIEPTWTIKKLVVMNEIDKYMRKNNYFQGDLNKKHD